jgi:apolipoprotein N-acyltransferase
LNVSPVRFIQSRYPLAIGAGLLLALSFPGAGLAGAAWIAPGLLLAAALGTHGRQSFNIGFAGALAHYLTSLYWLLLIPYRWHGIPFGPILGWLALSAFLAVFMGAWVWLATGMSGAQSHESSERSGPRIPAVASAGSPAWLQRMSWALACAAAWVAMEMFLARVFGGFPWNLLGASQYRLVPLIQIASATAVYGVSFLLVWTSVSLLNAVLCIFRRPAWRAVWIAEIFLPIAAVFTLFGWGLHRLEQLPAPARSLKVTLIQPSIPQVLIWDAAKSGQRFEELLRLSNLALTNETDLLIWPEAAIPKLLRYDRETFEAVSALARSNRVWMIVGSDDAEPREDTADPNDADFFNSSFLISPEGRLAAIYRKRNLVMFGEFVPLKRALPFLKWFTPAGEGFTPGAGPVHFIMDYPNRPDGNRAAKTAVLICYEDIFPHLARKYVDPDTDFLVNITNDGWFGEGAAQRQQAACAIFRTVENGLPLVRCANTGLTCWADAGGRLRRIFSDQNGSEYGSGYLTADIPLLNPGEKRAPTFYNQRGDVFGWTCVGFTVMALLSNILRRRRHRAPTS